MNAVTVTLRDPLVLAKQCATIDFLSGGRLLPVFGVGAGHVGLACAHYLRRDGHDVTVIDQGTIGGACSQANCGFLVVPRSRGQQLKEQAQLDGWLRDGSADYVAGLCEWE